jgi:hypothetical protein
MNMNRNENRNNSSAPSTLISAHLKGGLGNQLFQIFTALAYGHSRNRMVIFPYSNPRAVETETKRDMYWETFLLALKPYATIFIPNMPIYMEPRFSYTPLPERNDSFAFSGYWQSYKYFDKVKFELFDAIGLSEHQRAAPFLFLEDVHYTSIHFRLGDYKYIQQCHPIMPYSYYEQSLAHICVNTPLVEKRVVLYFCEKEDNETVLGHITRLHQMFPFIQFTKIDDSIPDWQQMMCMSRCHSHIIANSSFSWWGAYFNMNIDKPVCYPSRWFGEAIVSKERHDEHVRDLFPPEWQKIKAEA